MKRKNIFYIILAFVFILILKSCATSKPPENSSNKELMERIGQLEEDNRKLKQDNDKLKEDNRKLKEDNDKIRSAQSVETNSAEKPPLEANSTEETTDKSQTAVNKDSLLDEAINSIKNNFKNDFNVESEIEGNLVFIHMYPKGDVEKAITTLMVDQNNTILANSWDYAVGNITSMSKTFNETTGKNVNIMIHNPTNKENVIYSTYNNVEIYNFMKN